VNARWTHCQDFGVEQVMRMRTTREAYVNS
jgi:hypothetical protein